MSSSVFLALQDLWVRVGSTENPGGHTDPPCNGYKGPPQNINPGDLVTTVFVPCDEPMKGGNVTVERVPLPPGWDTVTSFAVLGCLNHGLLSQEPSLEGCLG